MAAPSRPQMVASRRHPLFFFRTSHPPYTTQTPQNTQSLGVHDRGTPGQIRAGARTARHQARAHSLVGFCAAHGKSKPAREDAPPPTAVHRHIRIMWCHRTPVPRPNAERRSLARLPEPTPHGRLRPITPGLQRVQHDFRPITICTVHHYILHSHAPTEPAGVGSHGIGETRHYRHGVAPCHPPPRAP